MATEHDVLLAEWKERCESYRQYRTQYLTVHTLAATAYLIGLSIALSGQISMPARLGLLLMLAILIIGLLRAHVIAGQEVENLTARINDLESQLDIVEFDSGFVLRNALRVTVRIAWIVLVGTLAMMGAAIFSPDLFSSGDLLMAP